MLSIFTPTHDPKHIKRLENSIKKQTLKDFEWLIVPNGKALYQEINTNIPNCRIIPFDEKNGNIGFIKNFCCNVAKGDILVEVDHDDEITPNALEEIQKAFQDKTVDFAYSNFCELQNGVPRIYDEKYGWKYRFFKYNSKIFIEQIAFPPSPASISKIWYAPNHIRAWRKSFYNNIGGHDSNKKILDDHDLLCRTYIHGKLKHIDECLYIYHLNEDNTSNRPNINSEIQKRTLEIHDQYIYQLVEKWCDLNNLRKIDLCCGESPPEGYEGVDITHGPLKYDLNKTWPFENESIGLFRAHDAIEHLYDPIHTMEEIYRCLSPNGWFLSQTPSTDGRGAFQDPTHVSFFNSNSFWYYTKKDFAKFIGTPVKFQLNRIKNFFPDQFCLENNIPYVKADLLKFQGRTPGLIEI